MDRISVTHDLRRRQQGAEMVAAAFTDHFTVILRLNMDVPCSPRGKGYWRMNVSFLGDTSFLQTTKENWKNWRTHMKYYPNRVMWRCRYVKRMIRQLLGREGADRRRDRRKMENFYYSAIYSALQDTTPQTTQAVALKKLKAKIIRLSCKHHLGMFIENGEQDRITGEEQSLHHLLKIRKRLAQRPVHQDTDGSLKTSPADILRVFTDYMRRKYDHIQVNEERIRHITNCGLKTIPSSANTALEESITMEELYQAVKQGKTNKAPGQNGICIDFINKHGR